MRIKVWGCRGSLATPGPGTLRYGGNTSCLEVRLSNGTVLILDAGTGIRPLGLELVREGSRTIHLLLTHLHFDHLEGLGFFAPLWMADTHIHLWGPPSPVRSLKERIARYMSPPLFPVQLSDVPAQVTFHDVPDEEWEIDGARLLAQPVSHPGPTVGYRVSEGDRSVAYIPDHEPAFVADLFTVPLSGSRATTWRTESTCYCTTRSTRLTSIRRGWDGGTQVSNRPSRSPESLAFANW